jgi:CheY-like chemotaxis protein
MAHAWERRMDGTAPLALVVDDDADQRSLTRRLLTRAGYAVEEAENGAIALAALAERSPLLLVLDLEMPVMGGVEMLENAVAHDLLRGTHIIVVSGASHVPVAHHCYRLPKPMPDGTLVTMARNILSGARSEAPPPSIDTATKAAG